MIELPPKIDIDGDGGLFLLPFAKRQLARFKKLLPFGKRDWKLPDGQEVTIWWGLMRDRIRITADVGKPWRDLRANAIHLTGGWFTRFFRGKGTATTVTKEVFVSSTAPVINLTTTPFRYTPYADADWSKDGKTFVSMVCDGTTFIGTMSITRGDVTVQVPNIITSLPTFISPNTYGPITYEVSDDIRPLNRPSNVPPHHQEQSNGRLELFVISADGKRVIAHSSNTATESFVIANWNDDLSTFQITRVALPPIIKDVVTLPAPFQPFNFPNGNADGMYYLPSDFPWGGDVYFAGANQAVAATDTTHRVPLLHFASTNKVYYYFRAVTGLTVTTLASGVAFSDHRPYTWYSIDGTIRDHMMVYDVTSQVWSVLRDRDGAFRQLRLVGNIGFDTTTTDLPPVNGEVYWHVLLKVDGTAQVLNTPGLRQPQSVQLAARDSNNNRVIVATVTMPGTVTFLPAPQPIVDEAGIMVLPDSGLEFFVNTPPKFSAWRSAEEGRVLYKSRAINEPRLTWRWDRNDPTKIMVTDTSAGVFLSKSGRWLFHDFHSNGPAVFFEGVKIWNWDQEFPNDKFFSLNFACASMDRDGFVMARFNPKPSGQSFHAMVSFEKQEDNTYKIKIGKQLGPLSLFEPDFNAGAQFTSPAGFFTPCDTIAEECYHSPLRT